MHVENSLKRGLTLGWCNKKGRWSQVTYECKKCEQTQSSSLSALEKTVQCTCLACTCTPIPLSLKPPVTSLAVLQTHTAKGTCSQPLAATPQTRHNPLFGYKSFKIWQRSRALTWVQAEQDLNEQNLLSASLQKNLPLVIKPAYITGQSLSHFKNFSPFQNSNWMLLLTFDQEEALSLKIEVVSASPPSSARHQLSETWCKNLPADTAFTPRPPCRPWLYHY